MKCSESFDEQKQEKKEPSAAVVDSQSMKTTEKGGAVDMMVLKK